VYGATKAGIIQMTKYFSVNALADGANIRVNAVAPGGIKILKILKVKIFRRIMVRDVLWAD
jgi:NAD(P)-dependent dehydrogenase (short-subunit alcohol dehydrogenase family)